nr:hypothetical protein [Verrucomicrobiota bacterium]
MSVSYRREVVATTPPFLKSAHYAHVACFSASFIHSRAESIQWRIRRWRTLDAASTVTVPVSR